MRSRSQSPFASKYAKARDTLTRTRSLTIPCSLRSLLPSVFILGISTCYVVMYAVGLKYILHYERVATIASHTRTYRQTKLNLGAAGPDAPPWYDFSSVPPEVAEYVSLWTYETGDCTHSPGAVVVACCQRHCAGLSDRVRGLALALTAARHAGRRVCLTRDYFVIAPRPDCADGRFKFLSTISKESVHDPSTLAGVKYLCATRVDGIPELGLEGDKFNSAHMKRIGTFMIAHSGVLNAEMRSAQLAVRSALGLNGTINNPEYVALHIRCGGSTFNAADGGRVKCLPYKDGHVGEIANLILDRVRKIPQDVVCKRKLFIASDSHILRAELEVTFPIGVETVSCCSRPLHLDYNTHRIDTNQHLIDVAAFSMAKKVYVTSGGYGELGAFWRTWQGAPIHYYGQDSRFIDRILGTKANALVASYVNSLLEDLRCR